MGVLFFRMSESNGGRAVTTNNGEKKVRFCSMLWGYVNQKIGLHQFTVGDLLRTVGNYAFDFMYRIYVTVRKSRSVNE